MVVIPEHNEHNHILYTHSLPISMNCAYIVLIIIIILKHTKLRNILTAASLTININFTIASSLKPYTSTFLMRLLPPAVPSARHTSPSLARRSQPGQSSILARVSSPHTPRQHLLVPHPTTKVLYRIVHSLMKMASAYMPPTISSSRIPINPLHGPLWLTNHHYALIHPLPPLS